MTQKKKIHIHQAGLGRSQHFHGCSYFGPKILKIVKKLPYDVPLCIAEDSVWPTDVCTPEYLRTVFSHYQSYGFAAVWVGAVIPPRKRTINSTDIRTLGRSKLFIATRGFVEKAWEKFRVSDKTMFVDGVMHQLVAERVVAVMPQFLAGSQEHWSARDGRYVESHASDLLLMGIPLAKGKNTTTTTAAV